MLIRPAVLVAVVAAVLWFVAATVLVPVRVSFGAGSVRCGTVLHPDTSSEVEDVCPAVTDRRLSDAWLTTVLFSGATCLSFLGARLASKRQGITRIGAVGGILVAWLLATALLLLWITGAHSPPG